MGGISGDRTPRRERLVSGGLTVLGAAVIALSIALLLRPQAAAGGSPAARAARAAAAASAAEGRVAEGRVAAAVPAPGRSSATASRTATRPSTVPRTEPAPPDATGPGTTSHDDIGTGTGTGTASPSDSPVVYVVRRGDSLWAIAQWFHLHGYDDLYAANRDALGRNPALITPGTRITVSGGRLSATG